MYNLGGKNSKRSSEKTYSIEVRCQAEHSAWGFSDHYFLVIGNLEYHLGVYVKGSILPVNSTKGSHLVCEKTVCKECYTRIVNLYESKEDKRLFGFYPLINCESLVTGFSSQAMFMAFLPFIAVLALSGRFLYAILLTLVGFTMYFACSKYVFSRTQKVSCRHLT
ncbi:Ac81-2 [Venturia canescens]|nr:uncharacterized LOC122409421 [Venturia canescens]XP_043272920.1 uncharacterized protein LOC122409421 [Venturia canescens]KAI5630640.1 Ac81-2 [Venturia canescens]